LSIVKFLVQLRESGIKFKLGKDNRLICNAAKGVMTPAISQDIKRRKAEIISFLQQASTNPWKSLVKIQPKGNLPPFFCFHGVGGNVLNYSTLIPYLDRDQPLYGLQSQGLDGITPPFQEIKSMVSHYINEIKTRQPHGPYYLGGGSMGGMIALEAAQQLQNQGEKIAILVMFDSVGPNYVSSKFDRMIRRLKNQKMKDTLVYTKEKISEYIEEKNNMSECLKYQERNEPIPQHLCLWFVRKMNYISMENYEYSFPYEGKITLLKGTDEKEGLFSDPQRGWGGIATQGLSIYEIPGHHDNLVEQPLLGKILAECLKEAHYDNKVKALTKK
jgi:thioesterase domain-containing protein